MNVDEAMETAACYPGLVPLFCAEIVAITLAKEVERLRAELDAAKAASVPPVEVEAVYVNTSYEVVVCCDGNEWSAQKCADWLRGRVKERGEGDGSSTSNRHR